MGVDVVICNLTRFGDLLQSQAVIDDLHASGHSVGIVCLENFAGALPVLRHLDRSWPLPGAKILAAIKENWQQCAAGLMQFARDISSEAKPRHVLNLTPGLPSRLLTKLLTDRGAALLGFGLDEFGFGVNQGIWSSFLAVAAHKRGNSPINVADIFRKLALPATGGFKGDFRLAAPDTQATAWTRHFLAANSQGESPRGFIAFQPGASEGRRRWPVENFRFLGNELWRRAGMIPVLLGAKAETSLGEEYARDAAHPFINAIGQTNLQQLGALLKEARLLVTNDTGTMHLASGHGVPSLSFFLATAQPWDTGPLLDNCCCLEPALPCHPCAFGQECHVAGGCRAHISPQSAADLALSWLENNDWRLGLTPRVSQEARVWITCHDDQGMAKITLANHENNERGVWLGILREFWGQFLDGFDQNKFAGAINLSSPPEDGLILKNIASQAAAPLEQAATITSSLPPLWAGAGKSAQARKLFLLNCERLQTLLDNAPMLSSMAAFWRELRQSQGGDVAAFLPAASAFGSMCASLGAKLSRA